VKTILSDMHTLTEELRTGGFDNASADVAATCAHIERLHDTFVVLNDKVSDSILFLFSVFCFLFFLFVCVPLYTRLPRPRHLTTHPYAPSPFVHTLLELFIFLRYSSQPSRPRGTASLRP
jgi:hypothetical protein